MKNEKHKFLFLIYFLFIIFTLFSCQKSLGDYYNCVWTCEDPIIEFTVPTKKEIKDDDRDILGIIEKDNEDINITCYWKYSDSLDIFFTDKMEKDGEKVSFDDCIAISTKYKKRKGNKVYLEVVIDNIFDNKYKNITLTRHDL